MAQGAEEASSSAAGAGAAAEAEHPAPVSAAAPSTAPEMLPASTSPARVAAAVAPPQAFVADVHLAVFCADTLAVAIPWAHTGPIGREYMYAYIGNKMRQNPPKSGPGFSQLRIFLFQEEQ